MTILHRKVINEVFHTENFVYSPSVRAVFSYRKAFLYRAVNDDIFVDHDLASPFYKRVVNDGLLVYQWYQLWSFPSEKLATKLFWCWKSNNDCISLFKNFQQWSFRIQKSTEIVLSYTKVINDDIFGVKSHQWRSLFT